MSEEQIQSQMMKAQGYAVDIEHILRRIFDCDRYGFGGEVNSDAIRKHPFLSMTQGLAYLYAKEPQRRELIDKFINDFSFYAEFSLDDLLSFDENEKVIGIKHIQLQKENGLQEVEFIIEEFEKVLE